MIALLLALVARAPQRPCCGMPAYPPRIVQPADYRSTSGACVLHVDPSARNAAGAGQYRMTRDGVLVWERELPFTLVGAAVAPDGSAAGYAYTEGEPWVEPAGELVIAALAPDGSVRGEDRVTYDPEAIFQGSPAPIPRSVELLPAIDRFLIHIYEAPPVGDQRWVYELSSAKLVSRTVDLLPATTPESAERMLRPAPALRRRGRMDAPVRSARRSAPLGRAPAILRIRTAGLRR